MSKSPCTRSRVTRLLHSLQARDEGGSTRCSSQRVTHAKSHFAGLPFAEVVFVAIALPVNHVLINSSSARMFPSTR